MSSKDIVENKEYKLEEDEIDLKELFLTIKKNIGKIILFVMVITSITFVYVMTIPNKYESKIVLSPKEGNSPKVGGNLSSLAALAGVNLGGANGGIDPAVMLEITLRNYEFSRYMIEKYNLNEKLSDNKNLVFAFGIDSFYNLFKSSNDKDKKQIEAKSKDEVIFETQKILSELVFIESDKTTGFINLKVEYEDRFLAYELVNIYLKELISYVKNSEMKDLDNQIHFYRSELREARDVALKEQLSKSLSSLLQKRVFSKANEYYFVSKVVDSRVPYIKEKVGPKRPLILVVSFVTSFILGIFAVFLLEFIRNEKK